MNLRPCPNPQCRKDVERLSPTAYVYCPACGVSGPHDDPTGVLWNVMCDALATPAPLTIDQRADMVLRLVAHWRKRLTSRTRYDRDNETHWTGQDDEQLSRAIREMETWEAVQEKRNAARD